MTEPPETSETEMTDPSTTTGDSGSRPAAVAERSPGAAAVARRVRLEDLHAYYGDNHAVRGVSLEFPANGDEHLQFGRAVPLGDLG